MEGVVRAVEYGLTGWSDLLEEGGQPVLFSPGKLDVLPAGVIDELGEEVLRMSNVDEETREKLISMTRFSEFLGESKTPEIWECDWCTKNGKRGERDCPEGTDDPQTMTGDEREILAKKEARARRYGLIKGTRKRNADGQETQERGVILQYRGHKFTACPAYRGDVRSELLFGLVARTDHLGALPDPQGINDQQNTFIQAADIVKSERNKVERLRQAEEEGKRKKGGKTGKAGKRSPSLKVPRKSGRRKFGR